MHLEEFYGSVDQPARLGPPRGAFDGDPCGRSAGGGRDRLDSMRKGLSVFQLKANGKRRLAEYDR